MKRSKFTSFLFTIAFGLFAFNFSVAQNSANCQDEINFSLGGSCDIPIPYEAFNTWAPSCLTINDHATGEVVAAVVPADSMAAGFGPAKGTKGKLDCFVTLESVHLDTIRTIKITTYKFDAWKIDCDPTAGADSIAVDLSLIPAITETNSCARDTLFTSDHLLGGIRPTTLGTVIVDISDIVAPQKDCAPTNFGVTTDGRLFFRDTIHTITIKTTVSQVMKVDTFSHSDPLRYVKGTTIVENGNGATNTLIHDATIETKKHKDCAIPSFKDLFGADFKFGPAKLKPAKYTYNSQTPDSLNICWGKMHVEFKLWPVIPGRADTLNCVEFTKFSRAKTYDYHVYTQDKLEEICEWAEAVVRVPHDDPEPDETALRTDARIKYLANKSVVHCHDYVITHEDRFVKNLDWICDTGIKHRDFYTEQPDMDFYTEQPGHKKVLKKILTDTLYITSISIESVMFPDSVVAMDCGIIETSGKLGGGPDPHAIAEYLYHAFIDLGDIDVISGPSTLGPQSNYTLGKPCTLFKAQYQSFDVTADPGGALKGADDDATNANIWTKVFKAADYNNYGVSKAFPYVKRTVKNVDEGLKAKLDALKDVGDLTGVDAKDYTIDRIYIPVNKLLCNITATYQDVYSVATCEGEVKHFREWTLTDWCTNTVKEKMQIINFFDRFAPKIDTWEGKKSGKCDADDDNSKEEYYFGDLTDLASNAHITKIPDGLTWLNQTDHMDCDGDGNTTERALWIQGDCTKDADGKATSKYPYICTRYEKVTNPWDCRISHKFPWLTFKKDCATPKYQFEIVDHHGDTDGAIYYAGDVSENLTWTPEDGVNYPFVRITLGDDCENECEFYYYLKAVDKIPPVVVLHDELIVSLTADNEDFGSTDKDTGGSGEEDGIATIFCHNVDAGSHDGACGAVTCDLRRKGTEDSWTDFIHLTCDDLGEVAVEVRITDWSGNTAIGWMVVTVENKNGPFIVCEDVVIDCDDPIHPDWVGYPHVFDICASPGLEYSDEYNVDDVCFVGYIKRTWSIPGSGVQCVQKITIDSKDDGGDNSAFDPLTIHWPLHYTSENGLEFATRIGEFGPEDVIVRDYNDHNMCEDFQFNGAIEDYRVPFVRAATYSSFKEMDSDDETDFLEGCSMNDQFYCELGDLNEPYWADPVCGLVGKTYYDETFKFNDGVCFKVIRRWAVIDWCAWDPNHASTDNPNGENDCYVLVKDLCAGKQYFKYDYDCIKVDGYYGWDQEIKIADNEQPQITPPDDVTVEVGAGSKTDDGACKGSVKVWATAVDFCGGQLVVGEEGTPHEGQELDWVLTVIKVYDDGKQTVVSTYSFQGGNEVGGGELFSDENNLASVHAIIYGYAGDHYILKWRVEDGCNNPAEAESELWFKDVKAPVLFCIADLSTNAMSTDGTTEISADDYGFANDCDGDYVPLYFKNAEDQLVPYLTLTCDDIPNGVATTWEGRVYAVDAAGNEAFCEVTLRIVDSNDACEDTNSGASASVSGLIADRFTQTIESAEVTLGGLSRMTPVEGIYAFDDMPVGNNYRLDAQKVDDYMNGVSTLDLVLIQKHILGLKLFESPYQVLAGDINNDENVSAIDLVELRNLILGRYAENILPNNLSWRFANAAQTFDDILHPFPFAERINIVFLSENMVEDFVGVKIGDVSGNTIPNTLIAGTRSNGMLTFRADDASIDVGELVRVAISSAEFTDVTAFQFTMNLAGLEFAGIESGAIAMTEENIAVHSNAITAAWYDVNATSTDDVLFTLAFRVVAANTLSNAISISSSITHARAYNSDGDRSGVDIAFDTGSGFVDGAAFELYQNEPNPFSAVTTIAFQLAKEGNAELTVFDVTGKTVTVITGQYARGYNEVSINKTDLGASGVLYYQLESGDFTATRKMVVID